MPVRYEASCAVFEGACTVEEAGDLAAWLTAAPGRSVDLAECSTIHAAILQCLMALAPPVIAPPRDALLARWLAPVLALAPAAPEPPSKPVRRRRRKAPAVRTAARPKAAAVTV